MENNTEEILDVMDDIAAELVPTQEEIVVPADNAPCKKRGKTRRILIYVMISLIVAAAIACPIIIKSAISAGAKALSQSYTDNYDKNKNSTYEKLYNTFFDKYEKKYHVSNKVDIQIGDLKETQKLEVLKVSDIEYVIMDKTDNEGNEICWLEVPGTASFVVDLAAGEYIVDNERQSVLVRVPYPEIENMMIDYAHVNKLLFKDDIFNGSFSQGEEMARTQLAKADMLIKKEFMSNQHFYLNAQEAAISTIENLVRQLNPSAPDITIEVEFY